MQSQVSGASPTPFLALDQQGTLPPASSSNARKRMADSLIDFNGKLFAKDILVQSLDSLRARIRTESTDLPRELKAKTIKAFSEAIQDPTLDNSISTCLNSLQEVFEDQNLYLGVEKDIFVLDPSLEDLQNQIEQQRALYKTQLRNVAKRLRVKKDKNSAPPTTTKADLVTIPQPSPKEVIPQEVIIERRAIAKSLQTRPINSQDEDGNTPLHLAIINNFAESFLRGLCAKGADRRIQNNEGDTPLHLAVRHPCRHLRLLLRTAKLDLNLKNGDGKTCVELATGRKHQILLKFLKGKALENTESSSQTEAPKPRNAESVSS